MTQSVYVIGGAGTGKSTFTAALLEAKGGEMGPLLDLVTRPNSRGTQITLRGHEVGSDGMYLGAMREEFPGTDGLDRVSYIPGEAWLQKFTLPEWIVAEGATLAVRRFMSVLHEKTNLLVVYLTADDFVKELRFEARGSNQDDSFVKATATRARNLAVDLAKQGVQVWEADSAEPEEWQRTLEIALEHLS